MISGAMEPADEAGHKDLDAWYKEEHLDQATTQPGWRRSNRYKLLDGGSPGAPTWLALHEWDAGYLGEKVPPFDPITDWTKRVMGACKNIEAFNWRKVGSFGDIKGGVRN
jgi:hypothetical protein